MSEIYHLGGALKASCVCDASEANFYCRTYWQRSNTVAVCFPSSSHELDGKSARPGFLADKRPFDKRPSPQTEQQLNE